MEKKAHIDKLTADAVELLKEMIAIPSPSFREDEVCSHISGWMDRKGIAHRRVGNNIIAERIGDTSKPTLMICAHIDTVSPCEGYSFDPYKPDYQMAAKVISESSGHDVGPEDIVAGLGSNDDGASAVAMIAAFRYFSEASLRECRGALDNPSHSLGAGPSPCGQGGSTVLEGTTRSDLTTVYVLVAIPDFGHIVASPETDIRLWVFCIYSFHKVRSVQVSGCFSCYDVVFHDLCFGFPIRSGMTIVVIVNNFLSS